MHQYTVSAAGNPEAFGYRRLMARISCRISCERLKAEISITRYLKSRGVAVKRGRCVCPIHDGANNPTSFHVLPEQPERGYCHACEWSGDLIDLAEVLERHADTWTAIVSLAQQFNVPLPERPKHWHAWQDEKERIRQTVIKHLARKYQRRLVRLYAPLVLVSEETPEEELAELETLATELWPRCLAMAERSVRNAAE
jgi:hypothetical protein